MIIQRWQNLLLLVAAVLMACFTFCSLGQLQTADYTFEFSTLGFAYEGEPTGVAPSGVLFHTWYLFILSLMTVVLPLLGIVCFKNLKLQRKICAVTVLFIVAAAVVAGMLGYTSVDGASVRWSSIALAPFLAICAVVLAFWRNRSDDRKLRSADRLR